MHLALFLTLFNLLLLPYINASPAPKTQQAPAQFHLAVRQHSALRAIAGYLQSDGSFISSCKSSTVFAMNSGGQLYVPKGPAGSIYSVTSKTPSMLLAASTTIAENYFYWQMNGDKLEWKNVAFDHGNATFTKRQYHVYAYFHGKPPKDHPPVDLLPMASC